MAGIKLSLLLLCFSKITFGIGDVCSGILLGGNLCIELASKVPLPYSGAKLLCENQNKILLQFHTAKQLDQVSYFIGYLSKTGAFLKDNNTTINSWLSLYYAGTSSEQLKKLKWQDKYRRNSPFNLEDSSQMSSLPTASPVDTAKRCAVIVLDKSEHRVKLIDNANCNEKANVFCIKNMLGSNVYQHWHNYFIESFTMLVQLLGTSSLECAKNCHTAVGCYGFNWHPKPGLCQLIAYDQIEMSPAPGWMAGSIKLLPEIECASTVAIVTIASLVPNANFSNFWGDPKSECEFGVLIRFGFCSKPEDMAVTNQRDTYLSGRKNYCKKLTNPDDWNINPLPLAAITYVNSPFFQILANYFQDQCAYIMATEDDPKNDNFGTFDLGKDERFCEFQPIPLDQEGFHERFCDSNEEGVPIDAAHRVTSYSSITMTIKVEHILLDCGPRNNCGL